MSQDRIDLKERTRRLRERNGHTPKQHDKQHTHTPLTSFSLSLCAPLFFLFLFFFLSFLLFLGENDKGTGWKREREREEERKGRMCLGGLFDVEVLVKVVAIAVVVAPERMCRRASNGLPA